MTARLIAIRPRPGLDSTKAAAEKLGLDCFCEPLFDVQPCNWDCPDLDTLDGLLIGSANAIRHGGERLNDLQHLPVYAVGKTTAACASEAGFLVAQTGEGGLQELIDTYLDKSVTLLRLAGKERVDLTLPAQLTVIEREAYQVDALPMSDQLQQALGDEAMVLLHSAAAARHFAAECDRCSINREDISVAVLGPRIAEAAGEGWASIYIAKEPNDTALLALAADICRPSGK